MIELEGIGPVEIIPPTARLGFEMIDKLSDEKVLPETYCEIFAHCVRHPGGSPVYSAAESIKFLDLPMQQFLCLAEAIRHLMSPNGQDQKKS